MKTVESILELKMSNIIQVALDAVAKSKKPYAPVKQDMSIFHGVNNGTCFACLGGLFTIEYFDTWKLKPTGRASATGLRLTDEQLTIVQNVENALDCVRINGAYQLQDRMTSLYNLDEKQYKNLSKAVDEIDELPYINTNEKLSKEEIQRIVQTKEILVKYGF